MYIVKNAIKNLFRNKGRNLLISLILLSTVTSVTTCALIESASAEQVRNYRDSFRISATLNADLERVSKDYPATQIKDVLGNVQYYNLDSPEAGVEPYDYINSSYVDYHTSSLSAGYYNDSFKYIEQYSVMENMTQYYGRDLAFFRTLVQGWISEQEAYVRSDLFANTDVFKQLFGEGHVLTDEEASVLAARIVFGDIHYQEFLDNGKQLTDDLVELAWDVKYLGSPEIVPESLYDMALNIRAGTTDSVLVGVEGKNKEMQDGRISLAEGREPERTGECLISQEFAKLNNLSIGSKVMLENCVISEGLKKVELTVTGIYSADAWDATHSTSQAPNPNDIYTTEDTVQKWGVSFSINNLKLFLKNEDDLEKLETQMRTDGLSEYFYLKSNINLINAVIKPMESISRMSGMLMIVILILGGVLFLLLTFLSVRERKYEIGVLRAIGMKKRGVITGFICETSLIVLVCCILGLTFGTLAAQPVFSSAVPTQVDTTVENQIENNSLLGSGELDLVDALTSDGVKNVEQITTHLSMPIVLGIVGACLLLMMAAILISSLYITRFEPLKILSDQE